MTSAIRVTGLGKRYRISQAAAPRADYRTLRESLANLVKAPVKRFLGQSATAQSEDFWALKGIDFDVQSGEVVGIVGHNGAGKSTLLKILSRITKPTTGRVEFQGRIGSLLEVGTGFHPELTGRENVFLNGSILGMSRRDVAKKFDEIVAFAEVERFLDTPVKRYSSGMYVRLAFAVAAHLEPEILIIDEVLAVGDQTFQHKCLGKMGEVSRSGRTVLFVSHNMAAVESLCNRCLILEKGRVTFAGNTAEALTQYHRKNSCDQSGTRELVDHPGRGRVAQPVMTRIVLGDGENEPISSMRMGSSLTVRVDFDRSDRLMRPVLGVVIKSGYGTPVLGVNNRFIPGFEFVRDTGSGSMICRFDRPPLMPGLYWIDLYFGDEQRDIEVLQDAISFTVIQADVFGSGKIPPASAGPIYWPASFEFTSQ